MPCPTLEMLIDDFSATVFIVKRQTDGLTHAESLIQPPLRGNCLNWVVGHIVCRRNEALERLGESPFWDPATIAIYITGSDPIKESSQALPLESLLDDLYESQQRLEAALKSAKDETLERVIQIGEQSVTVRERLAGLHWHETYHSGQLELLRQLAGKNDKIF